MSKRLAGNGGFLATGIALAMALGPLTALSIGAKHAGEDAWERAYAGVDATQQANNPYAAYDSTEKIPSYALGKSLLDITEGAGLFDQFEVAVKAAELEGILSSDTPYTVFLPTDDAFASLSPGQREALFSDPKQLRSFVESHIVPGRISATDLLHGNSVKTLSGKTLPLATREEPMVGDAAIVKTEIAENGLVHVIDRVL